jgi:hypothetical protein
VDDLVVCGERGDAAWLVEELQKKFTISGGVLLPSSGQSPDEPVRFLKRRYCFAASGVVIAPHEKYIEELVKAHQMQNRNPKATPDITGRYGNLDDRVKR